MIKQFPLGSALFLSIKVMVRKIGAEFPKTEFKKIQTGIILYREILCGILLMG
jgi:hypothetical protein